jgi:hypothetical protein
LRLFEKSSFLYPFSSTSVFHGNTAPVGLESQASQGVDRCGEVQI